MDCIILNLMFKYYFFADSDRRGSLSRARVKVRLFLSAFRSKSGVQRFPYNRTIVQFIFCIISLTYFNYMKSSIVLFSGYCLFQNKLWYWPMVMVTKQQINMCVKTDNEQWIKNLWVLLTHPRCKIIYASDFVACSASKKTCQFFLLYYILNQGAIVEWNLQ